MKSIELFSVHAWAALTAVAEVLRDDANADPLMVNVLDEALSYAPDDLSLVGARYLLKNLLAAQQINEFREELDQL